MTGSPPHMRGKVEGTLQALSNMRITPAHAGKRFYGGQKVLNQRDHPRTCGEKIPHLLPVWKISGSPPHMRGKGASALWEVQHSGITPAHAGKSHPQPVQFLFLEDHPRTCGEKMAGNDQQPDGKGSPPHMRGKVALLDFVHIHAGITPAHAGKSRAGYPP